MKYCVYGGQYGSEGKGSLTEWLATNGAFRDGFDAVGEAAPNSGHSCSLGKTRNLPACSYWADRVLLGPDSVINCDLLLEDLANIHNAVGDHPEVIIHEAAAISTKADIEAEKQSSLESRISSTCSGSWYPRYRKYILREPDAIMMNSAPNSIKANSRIRIVGSHQWLVTAYSLNHAIFECSQGLLLDTCFGLYPHVTSRSTLPSAALARNGLSHLNWKMVGVYRIYPIRTGGPSGPTGGMELTWDSLGLPPEITTVTKRTRRVFTWSTLDFDLSIKLGRPDILALTHLDYLPRSMTFAQWLVEHKILEIAGFPRLLVSSAVGDFDEIHLNEDR